MSIRGNCQNCGKEYPMGNPKFCVRCGANLNLIKKDEVIEETLYPGQIDRPVHQSPRPMSNRLLRKREFKLFTNEAGIIVLFVTLLAGSQTELWLYGHIATVIIVLLSQSASAGNPVSYVRGDKSAIPIFALLFGMALTIPFIFDYFLYWAANIVIFSVAHYLNPPDEIIEKYLKTKSELTLIILAELAYVFFMYLDIPWLGLILSTGLVVYYIATAHLNIQKRIILLDIQPQPVRATPSRINYEVMSGVSPIINVEGTLPNLNNQLNEASRILERQVSTFELNLKNLDNQYLELKEIIRVKLPVELDNIEQNIQKNEINSRSLSIFRSGFKKIQGQVNQFEEERKNLIINYHDKYEKIIIARLETLLDKAKDNYSKITNKIELSGEFTIDKELSELQNLEIKLNGLEQTLAEHELQVKLEFQEKQQQQTQEALARQELKSFKLQEVISEKVISNLFAYLGAAFLAIGFLALLNFTYNTYILRDFPEDASIDQARVGVTMLYLFSIFIMTVPGLILNKFGVKFNLLYPIFMTVGILFLQLTLFVQSFYFENLKAENSSFAIIGSVLSIGAFAISYKWKSQLVGLFSTEFALWIFYISSIEGFITKEFVSFGFGLILVITVSLVYYRQVWIPLAAFSLFSPLMWLFIIDKTIDPSEQSITDANIWFPEYLTLGVAIANLSVVLLKKMPTAKPFSNFLATLFLIYPNVVALQFTVIKPYQNDLESFQGTSSILIVLTSFFLLYWIYVYVEKEIMLDMSLPVSYKFKEEQVQYQSIQQKLNWVMLSSLVILLYAGYELNRKEVYFPLLFFAVFLAIMSNVAIIKNFEKLVKSSSVLFIFLSQLFYVLNLNNPETPTIVVAVLSGIFLISFTYNFQIITKYKNEFNLSSIKLDPYQMGILIASLATINYIIASLSDFESIVLFVAVFQWILIIHTSLLNTEKHQIHRKLIHVASLAASMTLFVAGLLKQTSNFKYESMFDQIFVNLPLILILGYVFFVTFQGELLTIDPSERVSARLNNTWNLSFISNTKIYVPQILLFVFPNILILYGKPYFVDTPDNQIILAIYFISYFLALPILFKISDRKSEKSFSILSSLMGYFSFLFAFVFLGGAKIVYDKIIKSSTKFKKDTFIPLEWAIFLFVLIFVISISWTFSLSKKFENFDTCGVGDKINIKLEGTS